MIWTIISVLAGAVAAGLWLWSALVSFPKGPVRQASYVISGFAVGGNKAMDELLAAVALQSRLSGFAAGAACIAAAAQVAGLLIL